MSSLSGTKLQILHEHYVDTFSSIQLLVKARDRLLVVVLVILGLMSFQVLVPGESGVVLSEVVSQKLDISTPVNLSFLGVLIWASLLAATLRYFQTVINLEKLYKYIHTIEAVLKTEYHSNLFTRESLNYLQNYTYFSTWSHIVYRIIFPLMLIGGMVAKLAVELGTPHASVAVYVDVAVFLMIAISALLYMIGIYFHR